MAHPHCGYVAGMERAHLIDLLRITRNEALETAYQAQNLLDVLHAGHPIDPKEADRLAGAAMRHKMTAQMLLDSAPMHVRIWAWVRRFIQP
jgi:hypothetical protein